MTRSCSANDVRLTALGSLSTLKVLPAFSGEYSYLTLDKAGVSNSVACDQGAKRELKESNR